MDRAKIPFYIFMVNSAIMLYIFGQIIHVSLLKLDKHVETSSSIVFIYIMISSFLGIVLGVRNFESLDEKQKRRIEISLIGNSVYTLLVFLLLLFGALIV